MYNAIRAGFEVIFESSNIRAPAIKHLSRMWQAINWAASWISCHRNNRKRSYVSASESAKEIIEARDGMVNVLLRYVIVCRLEEAKPRASPATYDYEHSKVAKYARY